MARIDNETIPSGGPVGNLIFCERDGKHYVRTKLRKPANPTQTPANMKQKCNRTNLITNWKGFYGALIGCFESKHPGQSDNNAFVGVNAQQAKVYRSKHEAEMNASVAENFVVSMGTLVPPVKVQRVEGETYKAAFINA